MPLALLSVIPWKGLAVGLAVAVLLMGGLYAIHEHDQRVLAEARIADMAKQHAQQVAALEDLAAAQAARANSSAKIKEAVHANKGTPVCGTDPAMRAWVNGMRNRASGKNGSAAKPDILPTGALTPAGH